MTWVVFTLWLGLGAFMIPKMNDTDSSPVGSQHYTIVVNPDADSVRVYALAPAVDSAIRYLGTVPPHDSAFLRLPYADTKVYVLRIGPRGGVWQ